MTGNAGATARRRLEPSDIERLTARLLVTEGDDRGRKLSAFWVLIILSTVIASAGVMADSTATVIGAMIVAPLMTPILGTALSVVMARRRLILVNLGMVVAGALCVVVIAYLLGLTNQMLLVADTNAQIAARVTPRLIDLVAALATGVVGAFAMVRSDISDALPGVAIAISLVPPLAVVGLTLESGAPEQAVGALLLFGTNVTAIIATGTIVFLAYGVRTTAHDAGIPLGKLRASTVAVVIGALIALCIPLGVGSAVVIRQELIASRAAPVAREWAEAQGWQIQDVSVRQGVLRIVALGPPPTIQESGLRDRLDQAGLGSVDATVTLVLGGSVTLEGER
ncbi:TIGR00341 family protein [Tessaracoccus palaemonis]|uniref:TIGR00341 family protein n=1 Tax=Tessaracoccus palaemonis TaxID=2829499 RepID=A0ABX8SGH4_9ACTN|nr:TIGR00341 family protein [Tessaracoccus palaemonis]QXT62476.1 TIGR00341 family protein [Tessaracoccus palaemonis]